jgi:uncharacterized protein (DUF433 family)
LTVKDIDFELSLQKHLIMIDWKNHIESNPDKLFGNPVIINIRIPVDLILEKLAFGDTIEEILEAYPHISEDDFAACLLFGNEVVE